MKINKNLLETLAFSLLGAILTAILTLLQNPGDIAKSSLSGVGVLLLGVVFNWFTSHERDIINAFTSDTAQQQAAVAIVQGMESAALPIIQKAVTVEPQPTATTTIQEVSKQP